MKHTAAKDEIKKRKTLVELAGETKVRDPAAHAKNQVTELDKTAKRSQARRKQCNDQMEADAKELAKIEEQIHTLRLKYDPLVEHLTEAKARKKQLMETLEHCLQDQKKIMGNTKEVIQIRRQEESKMTKKMGSLELELLRGYSLSPESTFYQNNRNSPEKGGSNNNTLKNTLNSTLPPIK